MINAAHKKLIHRYAIFVIQGIQLNDSIPFTCSDKKVWVEHAVCITG